jgi:hypothetical protein
MADEPEDLGVTSTVSGYEADTNGETDKEMVEDSIGADDVDVDVDAKKIAAYGDLSDDSKDDDPVDMQLNGTNGTNGINGLVVNEEVQAEKDRVEAIDAFAREIVSSGEI